MNEILICGVCIFFVNVVFAFFFYRQLKKNFSSSAVLGSVREKVNKLVKEIDYTADRDISILEDRIASLQQLITKAEKILAEAKESTVVEQSTGTNKYTDLLESGRQVPLPVRTVETINVQNVIPEETVAQRYAESRGPQKLEISSNESALSDDVTSLRESVVLYTVQGFSPEAVAEKFDISRGEVELILSMAGL